MFGVIAKLPTVVHNVREYRDLRSYKAAKRSKRTQAGKLLDLATQAEDSIKVLEKQRRNGHRLVPPLLAEFDHRLIEFCRCQGERGLSFNRKLKNKNKYALKHIVSVLFGFSNKKEDLETVLGDCETWLIVAFYTTNLYEFLFSNTRGQY